MEFIEKEIKLLQIEKKLKNLLYINNAPQYSIEWGMNYITFSKSKRIRPLLVLESNLIFKEIDKDSYVLACAIELIHTYSLVHDDLPCMDNDDMRRGKKTLHKVRNEAYAVLVGDALLTRAFEMLSIYSKKEKLASILNIYAKKSGFNGMVLGQFLDLEGEGKKLKLRDINEINKNKTCSLIELSIMVGAINGNADENELANLENLGEVIGQIFQLKDDLLDITGDKNLLGKKTGSDEKNKKSSFPQIAGIDETIKIINEYKIKAMNHIKNLPSNRVFFYNLLDFLVERKR